MDIDYIHEFVVLAGTGNYMEAADRLFLTQSSLTRHIQKLEADLGVTLFDRTTRRIELNQYGRLFLPYAEQIALLQKDYTTAFCNELNRERGTIRIGAIPVMPSTISRISLPVSSRRTGITCWISRKRIPCS